MVRPDAYGNRSILSVADELNVNFHTVKYWMKKQSVVKPHAVTAKEKRPQDWSREEQLLALQETHGLSGEVLQAWCRERGVFAHHLVSWKEALCADGKTGPDQRALKTLKDENQQLKRELIRKEKALAEAAALLLLQKKFQALWEDGVE